VHESGSRHLADNSIFSNARFAPIMSKKSFLADKRNFLRPLMRFALGDMRDVIARQILQLRAVSRDRSYLTKLPANSVV
jgi:hypothetical protein